MPHDLRSVRTRDLLGMFWRSFFIQASWSYDRMQSLGFSFAMIPVVRRLYPDPRECSTRLALHAEYFNTQPYLASFVLGATARAEEERASGEPSGIDVTELKKTLMAPLGALGDSFFWGSLKPFSSAVAVALALAGVWWAPLVFLVLFNVGHVGMRLGLIFLGYASGGDVVAFITRYNITKLSRLFKTLSLSLIGGIAGALLLWRSEFRAAIQLPAPLMTVGGLVMVLGMTALYRRGVSPVKMMLGLAAACLALVYGGFVEP